MDQLNLCEFNSTDSDVYGFRKPMYMCPTFCSDCHQCPIDINQLTYPKIGFESELSSQFYSHHDSHGPLWGIYLAPLPWSNMHQLSKVGPGLKQSTVTMPDLSFSMRLPGSPYKIPVSPSQVTQFCTRWITWTCCPIKELSVGSNSNMFGFNAYFLACSGLAIDFLYNPYPCIFARSFSWMIPLSFGIQRCRFEIIGPPTQLSLVTQSLFQTTTILPTCMCQFCLTLSFHLQ
jgi:hypothetical protein